MSGESPVDAPKGGATERAPEAATAAARLLRRAWRDAAVASLIGR